jgi:hypothetical protein
VVKASLAQRLIWLFCALAGAGHRVPAQILRQETGELTCVRIQALSAWSNQRVCLIQGAS